MGHDIGRQGRCIKDLSNLVLLWLHTFNVLEFIRRECTLSIGINQ